MTRSPFKKEHFLTRMKRVISLSLFILPVVILSFSCVSYAANIEAVLDSVGGGSSFVVQDSTGAANPVASVDSAGKMSVKECLRINGSLAACTQNLSLIVDGNIGIGTVEPGYKLEVNGEIGGHLFLLNGPEAA